MGLTQAAVGMFGMNDQENLLDDTLICDCEYVFQALILSVYDFV